MGKFEGFLRLIHGQGQIAFKITVTWTIATNNTAIFLEIAAVKIVSTFSFVVAQISLFHSTSHISKLQS